MALVANILRTGNGSTVNFLMPTTVFSESHIRVYLNNSVVTNWDLFGDVVIFNTAPTGELNFLISDTGDTEDFPYNLDSYDTLASNIGAIENLFEIKDLLDINAENIGNLSIVGSCLSENYAYIEDCGSIDDEVESGTSGECVITTVAENMQNIIEINTNLPEIISSATTATEQAGIATEQATIATAQAIIATEQAVSASASALSASSSESNASNYASSASNSASIATTKAGEALLSENIASESASISSNNASIAIAQATIATEKANEASQLLQDMQELGLVTQSSQLFSATGGTNEVFTLTNPYTVGSIYVYREGFLLSPTEFTATDGTTVTILGDTTAGESIYVMSFGTVGVVSIPNTLTPADIGILVQAYNADTVIDSNYVHTDNNYTTAEKSKLSGLSNYTHPSYDGIGVTSSTSLYPLPLSGGKVISALSIAFSSDSSGHVTNLEFNTAERTLTPVDIGAEPADATIVKDSNYIHTDNNYTDEEKSKLASLENYTLPSDVVQDSNYSAFKSNTNTALGYIPYNIKNALGGVYDGSVDKTVEFRNAVLTNSSIYIPSDVTIKISEPITLHSGFTITGEASRESTTTVRKSKIIFSNDTYGNTPAFIVDHNVSISGVNFYRENAHATDTAIHNYGDIAIQALSTSVVTSIEIYNCSFYGFNKGIDMQNYASTAQTRGNWAISNCFFDCIMGIGLGNCKDTMYLENNHFYPFLGAEILSNVSDSDLANMARSSAIDILGDADWVQVANCFSHSYKSFISGDGFSGSIVGGGYDFEHYGGVLTDAIGVSITNRDVNSTITGVTFNGGYRHIYFNMNYTNGATPMVAVTGCNFNSVYDSYLYIENGMVSFTGNIAKEKGALGTLTNPNYIARVYNGSKLLSTGNMYRLPTAGAVFDGNVGGTQIVQANNMEL